MQEYRATLDIAVALAILGGLDERDIPRYSDAMMRDEAAMKALEGATRNEAAIERKQREWMKKKGISSTP